LKQNCNRAGLFGRAGFEHKLVKMFRADFGPAYTIFFAMTDTFISSYCWINWADQIQWKTSNC